MKYALPLILLLSSCSAAPALAVDTIEVKAVTQPAMCQAQGFAMPMPCAFMRAMMQRMRSRCGGSCAGQQTCAVRS